MPKPRTIAGFNTRVIALKALTRIRERETPLEQALDEDKAYLNLPTRDRAFVRMLLATSFRRQGQIDFPAAVL
jgi:16S rRNA (cytosine967-C5)-methyltransferase